jgi:predicted nucleic acid-binding protein
MYLIDTLVWIPALRKDGPPQIQEQITGWISNNAAATTGIIKIELLSGCKTESEADLLLQRLKGITNVEFAEEDFDRTAQAAFRLRRSGHATPVPDLLIACAAAKSGSTLVHADFDFERISGILKVKTINLLEEVNRWRAERNSFLYI